MGKKYIVEIGRLERLYKASVNGNGKPNMTWLSPEVDLTPYTEPDLEQVKSDAYNDGYKAGREAEEVRQPDLEHVRKKAYQSGYETAKHEYEDCTKPLDNGKAYQQGLTDAWEAVRKIYDLSQEDRLEIFPEASTFVVADICDRYSASECVEKIRQYEQEKRFCVGDEFENERGKRFVILKMDGTEIDRYIDEEGKTYCMIVKYKVMRKTGRHFPEIAAVLEKMKETDNG